MNKYWFWVVFFGIKLDVGVLCDNCLYLVMWDICNVYNRRYLLFNLCIMVYYFILFLGVVSGKRFCGWVLCIFIFLIYFEYV